MTFSEKIIFLRKKKGWSQEQLSIKLDISRQAVYKWEAGISLPEIDKLKKLSKIFGISYNDLLDDEIDIVNEISAETPRQNGSDFEVQEAGEGDMSVDDTEQELPQNSEPVLESPPCASTPSKSSGGLGRRFIIIFAICALALAFIVGFSVYFSLRDNDNTDTESSESSSSSEGESQSSVTDISLFDFEDDGNGYILRAFSGSQAIVNIPTHYNGKPIVAISNDTFKGNTTLEEITIPEGITSINSKQFYGCTGLKRISIPASVVSIDISAFDECPSLLYFEVSEENKKFSSVNGILYNKERTRLKKYPVGITSQTVYIPNGTHYVDDFAFYKCAYMTSCIFPDGVGGIGVSAFEECINLHSVDLGNRIDFVGGKAFYNCKSLERVVFEHDLYSIGSNAFANCSSLVSVEVQFGIGEIGFRTFYNCTSLSLFTLGGDITKCDENAFEGCTAFNGFLPLPPKASEEECKHAQTIKHERQEPTCESEGCTAYEECISCGASLSFPEVIEMIPHKEKTIKGVAPTCTVGGSSDSVICENCELLIKDSSPLKATGHSYSEGACLSCGFLKADECLAFELIGEEDSGYYKVIGLGTVTGEHIDVPSSHNGLPVKAIGYRAFEACEASTITVSDGIEQIDSYAFLRSFISKIELPASVKIIENNAFRECVSLKYVLLGGGVEKIGEDAFIECDSIESISYSSTVKNWCGIEFTSEYSNPAYYAEKLIIDGAVLSNLVTTDIESLPQYCFAGYDNLITVELCAETKTVGLGAFSKCGSLCSVEIYGADKVMRRYAFEDCTSVSVVNFFGTLKEWCETTFVDSTSNPVCYAKSLHINSEPLSVISDTSLTHIGDYAFVNCEGLTEISIPSEVTKIGAGAFCGCVNVCKMIFNPRAIESLGYGNSVFYKVGSEIGGVDIIIGKDATKIPKYMLWSNPKYTKSVTFETGSVCTSIGEYAFYGCEKLKSIILPENLTEIGKYAFYNCFEVIQIVINSRALSDFERHNYIFGYVGKDGGGITVTISKDVSRIPSFMFQPTSSINGTEPLLEKVFFETDDIPLSIGEDAFYRCASISHIEAKSLRGYLNISFENDNANPICYANDLYISGEVLTSLVIPDDVERINDYSIQYCESLVEVYISKNVTYIGRCVFSLCGLDFSDITFENTSGWYRASPYETVAFDVTDKSIANSTQFLVGSEDYYYRVTE